MKDNFKTLIKFLKVNKEIMPINRIEVDKLNNLKNKRMYKELNK